jgi:hypothetical protein
VYEAIDQPDYHYFTGDNQDYVAYVCLMVTAASMNRDNLWRDLKSGDIANWSSSSLAASEGVSSHVDGAGCGTGPSAPGYGA